ncbi:MAG TPA: hypothetical protein VIQ23_04290 [Hanamia sp.]
MKQFPLLTFLLLAFSSVNAQEKKIITQNEIRHFNLPDSLISPKMLAITDMPKAKFLYETNKGKVYALPLDNMPCLVTTIQSNMPVYKNSPKGYIPNALREREIIPDSHKK